MNIKKLLGMKTQEEKVDDGLRAMRDILDKMGYHDTALSVDEMIVRGSMAGKCLMTLTLSKAVILLLRLEMIKGKVDNETD